MPGREVGERAEEASMEIHPIRAVSHPSYFLLVRLLPLVHPRDVHCPSALVVGRGHKRHLGHDGVVHLAAHLQLHLGPGLVQTLLDVPAEVVTVVVGKASQKYELGERGPCVALR